MKKIISVIITVLLLSSCIFMTVSADNRDITFSNDYQKIYYDGYAYSRFNDNFIDYVGSKSVDNLVNLNADQFNQVEVNVEANEEMTVFYAHFEYMSDGSSMDATFMRDDCLTEFNEILKQGADEYYIDLDYSFDKDSAVRVDKKVFFGEEGRINGDDIDDYYFSVPVTAYTKNGNIPVMVGEILYHDGTEEFYFVDFGESGVKNPSEFDASQTDWMVTHKITDMELSLDLEEAYNKFYEEDFGFMEDDSFTESVSNVFMVLLFAVIPFVVFAVFLILTFKGKGIYKKFFAVISVLAASELVIFIAIAVYLSLASK